MEGKLLLLKPGGEVEAVINDDGEGAESFSGILLPGLINCHCHLELSHLRSLVPPGLGMVDFLISVVQARKNDHKGKEVAIAEAEAEMWQKGVQGVADICNTPDTLWVKMDSRIRWHSLVEMINFYDENLEKQLAGVLDVRDQLQSEGLPAVLAAHAPYTVSNATHASINRHTAGKITSIHNQESQAENELFQKGGGDFMKLFETFGDGKSPFPVSGKSSLQTWLPNYREGQTILLVHNTFISQEDIDFAGMHAKKYGLQLVFCLCPNANLYIEGQLPPFETLVENNLHIVVGTDSYSSNHQLSIASELQSIRKHWKSASLEMLLRWATSAGAEAMGWSNLGRFKRNTSPGVVLMNENDFSVKRIV